MPTQFQLHQFTKILCRVTNINVISNQSLVFWAVLGPLIAKQIKSKRLAPLENGDTRKRVNSQHHKYIMKDAALTIRRENLQAHKILRRALVLFEHPFLLCCFSYVTIK